MPDLVLFRSEAGDRWVEVDKPFFRYPGEYQVLDEHRNPIVAQDKTEEEIIDMLRARGVQWGSLLKDGIHTAKLDKLFGKEGCTRCARRANVLNHARENGVKKTFQLLMETFK